MLRTNGMGEIETSIPMTVCHWSSREVSHVVLRLAEIYIILYWLRHKLSLASILAKHLQVLMCVTVQVYKINPGRVLSEEI